MSRITDPSNIPDQGDETPDRELAVLDEVGYTPRPDTAGPESETERYLALSGQADSEPDGLFEGWPGAMQTESAPFYDYGDESNHTPEGTVPGELMVDADGYIDFYGKRVKWDDEQGQFRAWWEWISRDDLDNMQTKLTSYGAVDLQIMGAAMEGIAPSKEIEPHGQELAVAFYALGKISRIISAYQRGERPDYDSWHDLTVYSMMGRWLFTHDQLPTPNKNEGPAA